MLADTTNQQLMTGDTCTCSVFHPHGTSCQCVFHSQETAWDFQCTWMFMFQLCGTNTCFALALMCDLVLHEQYLLSCIYACILLVQEQS